MEIFTGWPGSYDNPSRGSITIEFCSHRARTKGTQIFVFVTFGQDQQKPFSNRNGATAVRTVKLGGVELFIGCGRAVGTGSATGKGEIGLRLHRSGNSDYRLKSLNALFLSTMCDSLIKIPRKKNNIFNPPICQQAKDTGTAQLGRFTGSPSNQTGGLRCCGTAGAGSENTMQPWANKS